MDEESGAATTRQPRRRSATPRPRRPRRAEGEAAAEGDAAAGDAPELAEAASE
jgi:hypothetical protein